MVLVAFSLGVPRDPTKAAPPEMARIGTALHVFSFCSGILLWFTYTHFLLSPRGLERAAQRPVRGIGGIGRISVATEPVEKCVVLIEKFVFLRFMAVLAGAGVGMFAAWCAVLSGVMRDQPVYWLNAVTTVLFVLWAWRHFPTGERLQDVFLQKIARA